MRNKPRKARNEKKKPTNVPGWKSAVKTLTTNRILMTNRIRMN